MTSYQTFLQSKQFRIESAGIDIPADVLNPMLYPFQRDIVAWALRKGKSAIFVDTGLGKTGMQLEWAWRVHLNTGGSILILAPLAVAQQTTREGEKFGIPVTLCRNQEDVRPGINVTNYDRLHLFDLSQFVGIVLDESSILKSYTGSTCKEIIERCAHIPFRLACSATPAPNDHEELGNHAEFLGVMSRTEMLSMFFVHDGGDTSKWRLMGHAEEAFWQFVGSWAVAVRKPSDLGYDDGAFLLPDLRFTEHCLEIESEEYTGRLFGQEAETLTEQRRVRRSTLGERCAFASALCRTEHTEQFLVWCELNDESAELAKQIPDAVEVKGSDSREFKEAASLWFSGLICDCQLKKIDKNAKLATWQNEQTITGNSTIKRTETRNSQTPPLTKKRTQKSESNTCVNTTPKISTCGTSELMSNENDTTLLAGRSMQTTLSSGKSALTMPEVEIQKSENTLGLNQNLELVEKTTNKCSMNNREDVLSAEPVSQIHEETNSLLTTVTKPERCEDFSAQPATWESESSKTEQTCLNEPSCTCGGIKNRRVLISKCSIFGYGMNFQSCARVVFVGVSHSYEQTYQAIRRCWRFGQTRPVDVHLLYSPQEMPVIRNLKRKQDAHEEMSEAMVRLMCSASGIHAPTQRQTLTYQPTKEITLPCWLQTAA